jgi:hypothetical protein
VRIASWLLQTPLRRVSQAPSIHSREPLDVQASPTVGVLAELGEQRFGAPEAYRAIQDVCGLARRKADVLLSELPAGVWAHRQEPSEDAL